MKLLEGPLNDYGLNNICKLESTVLKSSTNYD